MTEITELKRIKDRIWRYLELKDNWNKLGTEIPKPEVVDFGIEINFYAQALDFEFLYVCPSYEGGLNLAFCKKTVNIEFELLNNKKVIITFFDRKFYPIIYERSFEKATIDLIYHILLKVSDYHLGNLSYSNAILL